MVRSLQRSNFTGKLNPKVRNIERSTLWRTTSQNSQPSISRPDTVYTHTMMIYFMQHNVVYLKMQDSELEKEGRSVTHAPFIIYSIFSFPVNFI